MSSSSIGLAGSIRRVLGIWCEILGLGDGERGRAEVCLAFVTAA